MGSQYIISGWCQSVSYRFGYAGPFRFRLYNKTARDQTTRICLCRLCWARGDAESHAQSDVRARFREIIDLLALVG